MSQFVYSLLKGRALASKPFPFSFHKSPHYHILVEGPDGKFDIAVNIASEDPHQHSKGSKSQDAHVLFKIKEFTPGNADQLDSLSDGIRNLSGPGVNTPATDDSGNAIPGLDYVGDQLVTRTEMSKLPLFDPSQDRHGSDAIMDLVNEAVNNPTAVLYAFGHRYDQQQPRNQAWHFSPDDGVHNIHFNQGNVKGHFSNENGRHEDGALWIHFKDKNVWSAVYVAFQNQSWDNDDDGFPK